jgi:hypothetical protein
MISNFWSLATGQKTTDRLLKSGQTGLTRLKNFHPVSPAEHLDYLLDIVKTPQKWQSHS